MEKLGTEYGGWYIPVNICLNENSIIYSGGVGEDISFDLLISHKFNSNIYLMTIINPKSLNFISFPLYINRENNDAIEFPT